MSDKQYFQNRLDILDAQQQVLIALAAALIETHPRPDVLSARFGALCEQMLASLGASSMGDAAIQSADELRRVLSEKLGRTVPQVPRPPRSSPA